MEALKAVTKHLIRRYESQLDIELKAEIKAAKADDKMAEAMAQGGIQALRALRASVQQIHYVLYPKPEDRLAFILEPLGEASIRDIRSQIRTLKANDQYRAIGLVAQRALEFYEENNNDTDDDQA